VTEPDHSILKYYLGIVWRWKWLLVASVVLLVVIVLAGALRQAQVWENSSGVLLNHQDQVAASVSGVQTPPEDAGRYAVTQTLVAQSPVLARRVLDAVGRHTETPQWLYSHTSVSSNADVLQFHVHGDSADEVTRLANVYAHQFTQYRRELDTKELETTLASLGSRLDRLTSSGQQTSALYAQLAARQEQVRLIEALRRSNVYVIRTSAPDQAEQIAPRPKKDVALAVGAGLVLGLLLVAIANAFDRRVHDVRELEEALGAPLLARTPNRHDTDDDATAEAVRLAALIGRSASAADARAILVAPAIGDEPEILSRLAEGLAAVRGSALLVDADLRGRSLTRLYGLDEAPGLAELAARSVAPAAVAYDVPVATGTLRVVPAGSEVPQPAAVAASDVVARALTELSAGSHVTLVGAASLAFAPEGAILASAVDGVVLLIGAGIDRRTVGELHRVLQVASSVTLGFVLLADIRRRPSTTRRDRVVAQAAATPAAKQAATLQARASVTETPC
jgi:capsular polysaccharide biosynthesis protein